MSRSSLRHTSLRDHDLAAATGHPQRTVSIPLSALASRLRLRRSCTIYVNDEYFSLPLLPEYSQDDDLQLKVSAVNGIDSSRSRESKILVSHDVVHLEKEMHPYSRIARSLAPRIVCSPGIGSRERGPESEPESHPSLIALERLFR